MAEDNLRSRGSFSTSRRPRSGTQGGERRGNGRGSNRTDSLDRTARGGGRGGEGRGGEGRGVGGRGYGVRGRRGNYRGGVVHHSEQELVHTADRGDRGAGRGGGSRLVHGDQTEGAEVDCRGGRGGWRGRGDRSRGWRGCGPQRTPVQHIRYLDGLNEPQYILVALTSPTSGCLQLYETPQLSDEMVQLLLRVLEKACQFQFSPNLLMDLLQHINQSGFLNVCLVHYVTSRMIKYDPGDCDVMMGVVRVTSQLARRLPFFSHASVTMLLVLVRSWVNMHRKDREMELGELAENLEMAEEQNMEITKQMRRGDVMPDKESSEVTGEREPPSNFRFIETMPSVEEIRSEETPFLRKNIIFEAYRSVNHYLDVQYRLLREDFVRPLREGLRALIECSKDRTGANLAALKRISDIRFYDKVQVLMPYCTNKGTMYRVKFDMTNFRKVRWESSKRLIFGSLVGLSKDGFTSIIFATVADRQPEDLADGIFDLFFEDRNSYNLDLNPYTEYQMVECSAYFEAYRHVLEGLQEIQEDDLPFKKYLLNQVKEGDVGDPPRYLRNRYARFDFSCAVKPESILTKAYRSVPVLDLKSWPDAENLGLDKSQYAALQTALTKEFVVIQGPPGTGKTFIGLKIAQLMLTNRFRWMGDQETTNPILIVCFTNHALDQFLEGILAMCQLTPGELVRVGGRSNSECECLKNCNLIEIKKKRDPGVASKETRQASYDVLQAMKEIEDRITMEAAQMEAARKHLINESFLRPFMSLMQARTLLSVGFDHTMSTLPFWLLDRNNLFTEPSLQNDAKQMAQVEDMEEEIFEDDPDEVRRIQQERMMDDAAFGSQRKAHLNRIKERSKHSQELVVDWASAFSAAGKDGFEEQAHARRKKKKQIVKLHIGPHNMMTSDEAKLIGNVWNLSPRDRWRLYNYWVSCYCEERSLVIRRLNVNFDRLSRQLADLNREEDYNILKNALVIGMTTTGSAKHRTTLQHISPKIVIVEEAAEVMESHIVTAISKRCEHLIMIGDHQQLRPNPTVYKLAKEYHLDISLFERMVKNSLHCDQLLMQHRMRPEIVRLIVPHVYKKLLNDECVTRYPSVKGINGDVFFLTHKFIESSADDSKSRSNFHEAQFIAAFTNYLLQQGYLPTQITVLTTYTGQMFQLKRVMPKKDYEGVRITPVDNYQGEENDIILLSLVRSNEEGRIGFLSIENRVCVALSRAKHGLYIIGNMDILAEASVLWFKISKELKANKCLVTALPLSCQNHPATITDVATSEDFVKTPNGGCGLDCGFRLDCGHVCEMKCHPKDSKHLEYKCKKPCVRKICDLNHPCPLKCHEKCKECNVPVEREIPKCGHKQTIKCHIIPESYKCRMPCEKILCCGHVCQEYCGSDNCTIACTVIVADREWPGCGHLLSVECHIDPHKDPCEYPVTRILPSCGHQAEMLCCDDVSAYKCQQPCERKSCEFDHSCPSLCNEKCPTCTKLVERVLAKCGHKQTMPCFIKPDKHKCRMPCEKNLICGHKCDMLCGDDRVVPDCGHQMAAKCHINVFDLICEVAVTRTLPNCQHSAKMMCCEDATKYKCAVKVAVSACGIKKHQAQVECCKVSEFKSQPCLSTVKFTCPNNKNHQYSTTCCGVKSESCNQKCGKHISCGHACEGICGVCGAKPNEDMGHQICKARCSLKLNCEHFCQGKCGEPCPPCKDWCRFSCEHKRCQDRCGFVCQPCVHPCRWACQHQQCQLICSKSCTRPPCNEPCECLLPCGRGHRCIGLCGEPCPPWCRICNKSQLSRLLTYLKESNDQLPNENLAVKSLIRNQANSDPTKTTVYSRVSLAQNNEQQLSLKLATLSIAEKPQTPQQVVTNKNGATSTKPTSNGDKIDGNLRFLVLDPCGHVVEVDYMDAWVKLTRIVPPCKILPVLCPICKRLVAQCPRYNADIKRYIELMNRIKQEAERSRRFNTNVVRAINNLWPSNSVEKKKELLEGTVEIDQKLRRHIVGTLCVYQDCFELLNLCKDRRALQIVNEELDLDTQRMKLIKAVDGKQQDKIIRRIQTLFQLYLLLHVRRMSGFIKRHEVLNKCRMQLACSGIIKSDILNECNSELAANFTLVQKNYIEDFLGHLRGYFKDNVVTTLGKKRWLICRKDHVFECDDDDMTPQLSSDDLQMLCTRCRGAELAKLARTVTAVTPWNMLDQLLDVESADTPSSSAASQLQVDKRDLLPRSLLTPATASRPTTQKLFTKRELLLANYPKARHTAAHRATADQHATSDSSEEVLESPRKSLASTRDGIVKPVAAQNAAALSVFADSIVARRARLRQDLEAAAAQGAAELRLAARSLEAPTAAAPPSAIQRTGAQRVPAPRRSLLSKLMGGWRYERHADSDSH